MVVRRMFRSCDRLPVPLVEAQPLSMILDKIHGMFTIDLEEVDRSVIVFG